LVLGRDVLNWLSPPAAGFHLTSLTDFFNIVTGHGAPGPDQWSPPDSWPGPLKTLMGWPSWAVIGVVGLVLALIFRRRD
jgi:hypothetical protein